MVPAESSMSVRIIALKNCPTSFYGATDKEGRL